MRGVRPADDDRLPWLEPYRDAKKTGRPLPRRGFGRTLAYGAGIGLLLTVGGGGYWLGQRDELTVPAPAPPSTTIPLPAPKPAPVQMAEALPAGPKPAAEQTPAPTKAAKPVATKTKSAARKRTRPKKIRSAGVEQRRAAQPRRPVSRPWPKMPSPGPAGQVIQLGAFSSLSRASAAYRTRVARYPLLARMPRVIIPVATKPTGQVLYVLRLGTTSRQQSKTVCRNLRRSGDHCLVIG